MYLEATGTYTLQKAVDATGKESKTYRHQIPYTPVHAGAASLALEHPWANVSWLLNAVSSRYSLPQNIEANRMDGYVEQQLSVYRSFPLRKGSLRVQADVLNLFDVAYDVVRYYPMPGRSFRLSIRYRY
jgi:outer membrane cobalamin receptor